MSERIVRKLSLERLPRRHRPLAVEAIAVEAAREKAENEKRRAAIERVIDEHRRAVHDLAGPKSVAALGEAARRERAVLRDLRRTPGGRPLEAAKAVRDGRKRLARAARDLGVHAGRLRQLAEARARRLARLTVPPAAAVKVGRLWNGVSLPGGIGLPIDPPDQTVIPPFPIGVTYRDSDPSEGFTVDSEWEIDEPIGRIATRTRMRCPDADWWNDFAFVWVEADLVFVCTAPATGRLSVTVEATNLEGTSRIRLEDEFGFSGSETHLRNYLTLRVYHPGTPGVSYAEMSYMSRTGTDGDVAETHHYPGSNYLATLESNGSVQQGDTFFVAIGTRNSDWSSTDDVEVETSSDFAWLIRSLDLRMLDGGPVIAVDGSSLAGSRVRKRRSRPR